MSAVCRGWVKRAYGPGEMILCHVLFASVESRIISQQVFLEDCFPKWLPHTSACVSAVFRKEKKIKKFVRWLFKRIYWRRLSLTYDFRVRNVIHTFHSLFVAVTWLPCRVIYQGCSLHFKLGLQFFWLAARSSHDTIIDQECSETFNVSNFNSPNGCASWYGKAPAPLLVLASLVLLAIGIRNSLLTCLMLFWWVLSTCFPLIVGKLRDKWVWGVVDFIWGHMN